MFKNVLISLLVAGMPIASVPTLAASTESHPVSEISVANSTEIEAELMQATDKRSDKAENASHQITPEESNESSLPSAWLFAVALFWFVVLSNRRGV